MTHTPSLHYDALRSRYDEDLEENLFFQVFKKKHKKLHSMASTERWTICTYHRALSRLEKGREKKKGYKIISIIIISILSQLHYWLLR